MRPLLIAIMIFLGIPFTHAQITEEVQQLSDSSQRVKLVIPNQWQMDSPAELTILNSNGKKMYTLSNIPLANYTTIPIDISHFKNGTYTMRITVSDPADSIKYVEAAFIKSPKLKTIYWYFLYLIHNGMGYSTHKKPVIYLYPQRAEDISVKLNFNGVLTQTIPAYNQGWMVNAQPDGTITNISDGKNYPYIFWEGTTPLQAWNMKEGFVVSAANTKTFLDTILPQLGLNTKEAADFRNFWLPQLVKNPYNLIHFSGKEYEQIARLNILPQPDAELIVFMAFEATAGTTKVQPQHITGFIRRGFTVVEWGGADIGPSL